MIHEDAPRAVVLDIADLYRDTFTLPIAFTALKQHKPHEVLERGVRKLACVRLHPLRIVEYEGGLLSTREPE